MLALIKIFFGCSSLLKFVICFEYLHVIACDVMEVLSLWKESFCCS